MKHSILGGFALLAVMIGCTKSNEVPATPTATVSENAPAPAAPAPAAAPKAAPDEIVKRLYAAKESPFFQTTNRALVDTYFERTLADLIWNDTVTANGDLGAIDFDPLYDAQDTEITNLVINPGQVEGTTGRVVVTFDNFGKRQELVYSVVDEAGTWKISDIRFTEGATLRGMLTPAKV